MGTTDIFLRVAAEDLHELLADRARWQTAHGDVVREAQRSAAEWRQELENANGKNGELAELYNQLRRGLHEALGYDQPTLPLSDEEIIDRVTMLRNAATPVAWPSPQDTASDIPLLWETPADARQDPKTFDLEAADVATRPDGWGKDLVVLYDGPMGRWTARLGDCDDTGRWTALVTAVIRGHNIISVGDHVTLHPPVLPGPGGDRCLHSGLVADTDDQEPWPAEQPAEEIPQ